MLFESFSLGIALTDVESPVQRIVVGSDAQLQCSNGTFPGVRTEWVGPGGTNIPAGILQQVTLQHQGQYQCSIISLLESGIQIYSASVEVQVLSKK